MFKTYFWKIVLTPKAWKSDKHDQCCIGTFQTKICAYDKAVFAG